MLLSNNYSTPLGQKNKMTIFFQRPQKKTTTPRGSTSQRMCRHLPGMRPINQIK